jgi:dephospho-CoA kinase
MKIFGLTGGMGSGKSTIAKLFAEQGAPCIDADQVARKLREPGQPGNQAIQKRFGTTDAPSLRQIISQNPTARKDLEAILHPLIKAASDLALKEAAQSHPQAPFLLYEATLLIEAERKSDFDGLIIVTASVTERVKRVVARDQITEEQALRLIQTQMKDEERLLHATYTIKNEGSLEDLRLQVRKVLDQIIST